MEKNGILCSVVVKNVLSLACIYSVLSDAYSFGVLMCLYLREKLRN